MVGKVRVMARALNMRSAPSLRGDVVGEVRKGTVLYVVDTSPKDKDGNGRQAVEWAMIGDEIWVRVGRGWAEWVERYD